MISGTVNDELEPQLQLSLRSLDNRELRLTAVIDTAFSGYLTVPLRLIEQLRLPILAPTKARLADGTQVQMDNYLGSVVWNGRDRTIIVLAADGEPLMGTEMLRNHSLHIVMAPGGDVIIRSRRDR